jgi:hypothetical protein
MQITVPVNTWKKLRTRNQFVTRALPIQVAVNFGISRFDSCLSYKTKLLPTKRDRSLQKHMSKELNKNTRKAHRHSFHNRVGEGVWMWRTKKLWIQFSRTGHQSKTGPCKSNSLTQSTTKPALTSQHKQVPKRRANSAHELGASVEYAHQTAIQLLQWHCSKVIELAATSELLQILLPSAWKNEAFWAQLRVIHTAFPMR